MKFNNYRKTLLVGGLLALAFAISPFLMPQEGENSFALTNVLSKQAAEDYRQLRLSMENNRTIEGSELTEENLARLIKEGSALLKTDGKYATNFQHESGTINYDGTAGFVFVQGSGSCQISIDAKRNNETYSGRSVGCTGTINEKTGRFELSGKIITDSGRNKPFDITGDIKPDNFIEGIMSFDGVKIELESL